MTDQPRCSGLRCGGPDHDYRDVPCSELATTTFDGKPCCEEHRVNLEANAHERFAEEGFFAGVPLERIFAIQRAGGLAKLLHAFDGMYAACNLALPYLWNAPLEGATEAFDRVRFRRNTAESFMPKED